MNNFINRTICLLAALWLAAPALQAGEGALPATSHQKATDSHRYSEQTLDAFAAAYVKVAEVYDSHAPRFETAKNAQEAYRVQMAINDQMSRVIREQGLSPEEYNQVVRSVNEDPQLAQSVARKIRALQ